MIMKTPEMCYDILQSSAIVDTRVRGLSAYAARGIFLSDQCFIALAEKEFRSAIEMRTVSMPTSLL